ncbi:MAG TPA: nucleotidyl transferase AbiEii/AbiGii toxin family protein [Polyangiaceae bacterium]|nr:nucleotidyl transferase AbiEii/AbiGii toxin family protein [Polyangiaceae bacterium]HMR77921.1 nucleotidyl transferase AbiEii/AbiGii toxin family protein [Polyangiaceae bacterium]
MASPGTLTSEQQRALDRLGGASALRDFYLAGGCAIGLHLGHRSSVDLDVFSTRGDVSLDELRLSLATEVPEFEVVGVSDATLNGRVFGVPVDIVRYPYPPLGVLDTASGPMPVASLLDLATMKVSAIARRGIRRDFWDLHEIIQRTDLDLETVGDAFKVRFGRSDADLYHVLKAMTYFEDAEADTLMPHGMDQEKWRSVRDWFEIAAPRELARRLHANL